MLALAALSALLVSCETINYYEQAARGQLVILFNRRDINRLLADDATPQPLRQQLQTVLALRDYAAQQLDLPVGDSYLSYVELEREHVLWNVFAAPEFSLDPLTWCYPIAGCVSYRGYFSEARALRAAEKMADAGYDVYTGSVDAYSTLGWFADPVFSTVIARQDYQLAELIFHELAHQRVYFPGDTTFNESFATFVEREGVRRWLGTHEDFAGVAAAELSIQRQAQFVELVSDYREQLEQVYDADGPAAEMRQRKEAIQAELREAYQALKAQWQGYTGYDRWFASSLNNAQLSTVTSYNDLVPGLAALLQSADGDLQTFYQKVEELRPLTAVERRARLLPDSAAP